MVLADLSSDDCSSIRGCQWLLPMMERLKPVVVEQGWPPKTTRATSTGPSLLEGAKAAGCTVVEATELIFAQACACMSTWMGHDIPRTCLAKAFIPEMSKIQIAPEFL